MKELKARPGRSIGDRIIAERTAKGWNQVRLAKELGVNLKNVSRWELGQAKPSLEAAIDLAKVLEVSLDHLAGIKRSSRNAQVLERIKGRLERTPKKKLEALLVLLSA